jgi:hypothetical protein
MPPTRIVETVHLDEPLRSRGFIELRAVAYGEFCPNDLEKVDVPDAIEQSFSPSSAKTRETAVARA